MKLDYTIKSNWKLIFSGIFTGSYSFFNFFVLSALLTNEELIKVFFADAIWNIPALILINIGSSTFYDKDKNLSFKGLSLINIITIIMGIIIFVNTKSLMLLAAIITLPFTMYVHIASEKLSRERYKYIHLISIFEIFIGMLGNIIAYTWLKDSSDLLTLYFTNYLIGLVLIVVPVYVYTSKLSLKNIIFDIRKISLIEDIKRIRILYLRARPKIINSILLSVSEIFILKNTSKVAEAGVAIIMVRNIHNILSSTIFDLSYVLKKNIVNITSDLKKHRGYYNLVLKLLVIQVCIYMFIYISNSEYNRLYLINGIITSISMFYIYNSVITPRLYALTKYQKFKITTIGSFLESVLVLITSVLFQDIFITQIAMLLAMCLNAIALSVGWKAIETDK